MVEKEGTRTVVIFVLVVIFAAIIILFIISTGIASSYLGGMPWITSVVTIFLTILGLK